MKRLTLFAVALAASSTFASAADMSVPSYDWSGFYAGVDGGVGFGRSDWSDIQVGEDPGQNLSGKFASSDFSGAVGGVQAGYNYQTGMLVLGIEGDVGLGSLEGSDSCFGNYGDFTADCETKVNWMADIDLRLGITPVDRLLMYVKGGAAYANADFTPKDETDTCCGRPTGGYGSSNEDRWGYILGAGAEFAFDEHWIVGAEYNYRNFGDERTNFSPHGLQNQFNAPFSAKTSLDFSTVVLRLSYKF